MNKTLELAFWINERYSIKLRKESGMCPPWTADPIMQNVRWCNVHREDDATTRWMRQNWHWEGKHPVWFWVLGRMLNYIPTLNALMYDTAHFEEFNLIDTGHKLKDIRERGMKVFTSAYTISTCGKSMEKINYVLSVVEAVRALELYDVGGPGPYSSLGYCEDWLSTVNGLGSFLAAQVVADLKNTPGHPLAAAPDWWTWAAPGPGSLRGLNWYYYGTDKGGVTASKFMSYMTTAYQETIPFVHDYVPRIGMQDFQNCLCEFSKYMKVKCRSGHVRNRYTAG